MTIFSFCKVQRSYCKVQRSWGLRMFVWESFHGRSNRGFPLGKWDFPWGIEGFGILVVSVVKPKEKYPKVIYSWFLVIKDFGCFESFFHTLQGGNSPLFTKTPTKSAFSRKIRCLQMWQVHYSTSFWLFFDLGLGTLSDFQWNFSDFLKLSLSDNGNQIVFCKDSGRSWRGFLMNTCMVFLSETPIFCGKYYTCMVYWLWLWKSREIKGKCPFWSQKSKSKIDVKTFSRELIGLFSITSGPSPSNTVKTSSKFFVIFPL